MTQTIKYGDHESQIGDLYIPSRNSLGIVCLFHGGFWKMPYDRFQFDAVAKELTEMGYCVWNIEYRKIGESGRVWTDTFTDAIASIQALSSFKDAYSNINIDNIFVVGHSAGGHLALWLSSQDIGIKCTRFVGLAPILDLRKAFYENIGGDSVFHLLDGTPEEYPGRYKKASPIEMLPSSEKQVIFHGVEDEDVFVNWSRDYVSVAKSLGRDIEYIEIEKCRHMEFVDPNSEAFRKFTNWLNEALPNK